MSGRIASVYHYHVDATVLSSDGKGHIHSTAVTSPVTRPTYSSSGILNYITALWFSPGTVFCCLSHLTLLTCFVLQSIAAVVFTKRVNIPIVLMGVHVFPVLFDILLLIQILYECCFLVNECSQDDYMMT